MRGPRETIGRTERRPPCPKGLTITSTYLSSTPPGDAEAESKHRTGADERSAGSSAAEPGQESGSAQWPSRDLPSLPRVRRPCLDAGSGCRPVTEKARKSGTLARPWRRLGIRRKAQRQQPRPERRRSPSITARRSGRGSGGASRVGPSRAPAAAGSDARGPVPGACADRPEGTLSVYGRRCPSRPLSSLT